ncbi:hypothetical protein LCGC14_0465530 [marine sediment metagenome]|uniref:Uncharacterized protein n=1 Tax=marine sediment metagenome TaxID=412755 RepID=A0A0F9SIV8_9ZZZZ
MNKIKEKVLKDLNKVISDKYPIDFFWARKGVEFTLAEVEKVIDELDGLYFSYGNSIDDCLNDKDYKKTKELLEEFYQRYRKIKQKLSEEKGK